MSQPRRRRIWGCLALLLLAAWVWSTLIYVRVDTPTGVDVGLTRGRAFVDEGRPTGQWRGTFRWAHSGRGAGVFGRNGHFDWVKVYASPYGYLTLIPIWPFIITTGAAWFLLWTPKRPPDVCAKCGYPRGVSPVCTECGVPHSGQGEVAGVPRRE